MLTPDQLQAAQWARDILQFNPLILDSETTGLDGTAEICQIAIVDAAQGQTVLDTLVKPTWEIPIGATRIHGITNAMVADAPNFLNLSTTLGEILYGRAVIVYNADFDIRMLTQSHHFADVQETNYRTLADWHCAMLQYAQFIGDWDEYHGHWSWHKLDRAIRQERLTVPDAPAHSALGDCLRTLALLRKMAESAGQAVLS